MFTSQIVDVQLVDVVVGSGKSLRGEGERGRENGEEGKKWEEKGGGGRWGD